MLALMASKRRPSFRDYRFPIAHIGGHGTKRYGQVIEIRDVSNGKGQAIQDEGQFLTGDETPGKHKAPVPEAQLKVHEEASVIVLPPPLQLFPGRGILEGVVPIDGRQLPFDGLLVTSPRRRGHL